MTMRFKSRLTHRIILSFVLLTAIVSGLFTLGLTATIHYVEESLVTGELRQDFDRAFDDYRNGRELRLDEGTAFFPAGPALPDYLQSIPTGYTEIVLEDQDRAYFVYHLVEDETSYFLLKDQTAFEQAEILLQRTVYGGFVLCVLASLVLGLFMARQVIAPVRKLTRRVAERGEMSAELRPLAPEYAVDEVGALAEAFDASFARLQQALRREALFTSDVSHELRTPLMVIHSACDLLLAREELDEYSRKKIVSIRKAASQMKGLVEAFLALARGKNTAAQTATLEAIVEAEFADWEQLAAPKKSRLLLQEEPRGPEQKRREYPAVLLRTVIDNLIRNAVHHTSGSEIVLVLNGEGFDLRDSGEGIAADERDKVFEPYCRGETSHNDGLGLGLSLVQRICEREHWTLRLEQNHPRGCCFRIRLG